VNGQYNSKQAPVKNCKSAMFPVGSHICLHGEKFTVANSWNTGSGATVNIEETWPSGDFFKEDDEITPHCSNFRALPKRSCDPATKATPWYSYGSRAEAEEACKAEGCEGLGTKEEQIEYGPLCAHLYSSDAAGFFMNEKHDGCGNKGWNNGQWRVNAGQDLGAFCAGCPDCPPEDPTPVPAPEPAGDEEATDETPAENAATPSQEEGIPGNRCGPKFHDSVCDCNGDFPNALYCNEMNGWCGNKAAHRDAQESTKLRWRRVDERLAGKEVLRQR
jgi:hypothetical protein